ncbi:hypothetical protein [Pseudomonas sp. 58 R 12]|nr:hypothetical protein [Pseudomonas sp. 58 R 12]
MGLLLFQISLYQTVSTAFSERASGTDAEQ